MSNGGIKPKSDARPKAECVTRNRASIRSGQNGVVKSSLATTTAPVNRNAATVAIGRRRPTLSSTPLPAGHVTQNDVTPTDGGPAVGCFACIGRKQVNSKTRHKALPGEANNTKSIDNVCRHHQNGRPPNGDVIAAHPPNNEPRSDTVRSDSNGNTNFKYCNILSDETVSAAELSFAGHHQVEPPPHLDRTSVDCATSVSVSRCGDVNNSSFEVPDGVVVMSNCRRTAPSVCDNQTTVKSVVRSASRDGILRTTLVGDVNCYHDNHYVTDVCSQHQVPHSLHHTIPSSCSHGTVPLSVAVPTSVCRRRVPTSSTCSENLNRLYDCGRLSPEMTESRNSTATLSARYNDVRLEDEHRLIARYVERLSTINNIQPQCVCLSGEQYQDSKQQLVVELEAKNRAILQEIQRLRLQQHQTGSASPCLLEQASYQLVSSSDSHLAPRGCSGQVVPCLRYSLVDELCHLRRRRDELEYRMVALQSSRLELVSQLQELMSVLKSRSTTPSTSPRSPLPVIDVGGPTLYVVSGDVQQAFASHRREESPLTSPISYRRVGVSRDLLDATDYITDAVTSLVKELNSDDLADSAEEIPNVQSHDGSTNVQSRCVDFLTELRQHRLFRTADQEAATTDNSHTSTLHQIDAMCHRQRKNLAVPQSNRSSGGEVSDSCVETDQESYIRTDDEETGNTDWEEARLRWINR